MDRFPVMKHVTEYRLVKLFYRKKNKRPTKKRKGKKENAKLNPMIPRVLQIWQLSWDFQDLGGLKSDVQ